MIEIPFTKVHGAENDFLLTWRDEAPDELLPNVARRICSRHTGMGGDGWMLVWRDDDRLGTRLFNSDGTEPEISGNGTRCAAAFGLSKNAVSEPDLAIVTGAGTKFLRLVSRFSNHFTFEMNMGLPQINETHASIRLGETDYDVTVLNVGNPQCVFLFEHVPQDWRMIAQEAERHRRFPNRTNVSFVRGVDRHTVEAVFFERGVGETRSSGTGATGAAAAAILRGIAESPVAVRTPAGDLKVRWDESIYLTGPAEIVGEGRFFLDL